MAGKVAIITAASRGIGAACAMELAKRDYRVVLMSTTESVLDLAKELDGIGLVGNVTNADDMLKLVNLAYTSCGRVDALVNNTGHPPKGDLLVISDDEWHDALDLLLMNVIRITRYIVPIMKENGGGAIVNISAFGAQEPNLSFPTSSVIRSGLSAFTRLFAKRYGQDNIRMNSVLPGFVDSYDVSEEIRQSIPVGREATVEEIAGTVSFLLSDESSYITGQNLRVDGGMVNI
ncbi:MAG: oxidoreductase [Candidatus Marinimicrobia bacterium]|jgi:NAD(P)-dependent dehydrogenase (short-subunit alcohol dehydrogenase family)|nr:oxidoreductase [Candidatus Neomarinimicrobiota bacterium]|tara:strand:+ start:1501 stop:2199 length:699 start_codon:yes stop_codon:yes gene_type:complete